MTERERLAEMIRSAMRWGWTEPSEIAERLIEDGGIIAPPCKVGDRLFYIDKYTGTVKDDCVKYITVTRNDIRPILKYQNTNFWKMYSWGKTVFLTREEAEAALAEANKKTKQ